MKQLLFTKMVAAGNDFIVIDSRKAVVIKDTCTIARILCDRKYGVGADGVLVLERSATHDATMRIFNADGSEAEMCGNGARCAAWFIYNRWAGLSRLSLDTLAGPITAQIISKKRSPESGTVKIKLTTPKEIRQHIFLKTPVRSCKVNFINTGVPHIVIFVQSLEALDVKNLGKYFRTHRHFAPRGTNVNFVQVMRDDLIRVRTYERGVEDETLACGTGVSASAIITALELKIASTKNTIRVLTQSGETLKVHFTKIRDIIDEVWLEGSARFVFDGSIVPKTCR